MAEIRIEKRPPVWPWILGVLLLLVVGWIAIGALNDDEPVMEEAAVQQPVTDPVAPQREGTVGTAGATVPAAIQDYAAFASETAEPSVGREHAYTAEGIRRLSASLGAFVEQNADDTETRDRFDRFRQSAERLQKDPQSTEHAGTVREVFTSAVDVFESGRIDAGDVSRLRQTATSISADQPLLEQTDTVKQFFSQSAEALRRAAQGS
jgi:hypothetical protein